MATRKLFYEDSHLAVFSAQVVSCEPGKHGYHVVLDQTAFYPEGGGQPGDRGLLGGIHVTDTHEADGEVVHYCDAPLDVGSTVEGRLDWDWRFRLMQQHSGEHMVSGLIHRRYGYDNVGFHMGKDVLTIDFSGLLDEDGLREIEEQVNREIWMDKPVSILWPTEEELAQLPYRSKKALTGQVRVVEFSQVDLCACCGTHVQRTGEIGLVKFLSCQRFHDGVRIEMLAGQQAFAYLAATWVQNKQVSGLTSAKPWETAAAVQRLQQELAETKLRAGKLEEQLFVQRAQALQGKGDVLLFEQGLKPDSLRRLADTVMQTCGGRCAVFSDTGAGFQYAIGQLDGDLRAFLKSMNAALDGRGGGKPFFAQGSVRADRKTIEAFFSGVG